MKRYLAFYGYRYYRCGGMNDFIGDFDTKEDAIQHIKIENKEDGGDFTFNWGHIYDTRTRLEVWNNNYNND